MGGFAALLGHAAGGFEQARQQDVQRQFADEQNRRAMAGELLHGLITDPNQSDELRQAATQAYVSNLLPTKTGVGKPLDMGKVFSPILDVAARLRAQQAQPPTSLGAPPLPPQQTNIPGMQMGSAPTISAGGSVPLPPGVAGPPEQAPPQMSGGTFSLPERSASVQAPQMSPVPAPPQGLYAGPQQIAQNAGTLAAAQSGGALAGQMSARRQAFSQIPGFNEESPVTQAAFEAGLSPFGLTRQIGPEAKGLAGELRAMGYPVPSSIPDNQYTEGRNTLGQGWQFAAGVAPGMKMGTSGKLETAPQIAGETAKARADVNNPIWLQHNAIQFGQRQALLNQQFELGVQRGYYGDANKAFVDSVKDYGAANKTMQSMDEAYRAVQQNPNNQQAQVALLMAHIGMTLGVVKGARVGKAQIEEAEQSRTMFAGAASKLNFDKDGNLDWSDPIRKGVTLTPDQMKQMVELGHQRMGILKNNIKTMHDGLDPTQMDVQPLGTSFNQPKSGGRSKKLSAPPSPPSGGGGNSIVDELIKKHGGR